MLRDGVFHVRQNAHADTVGGKNASKYKWFVEMLLFTVETCYDITFILKVG